MTTLRNQCINKDYTTALPRPSNLAVEQFDRKWIIVWLSDPHKTISIIVFPIVLHSTFNAILPSNWYRNCLTQIGSNRFCNSVSFHLTFAILLLSFLLRLIEFIEDGGEDAGRNLIFASSAFYSVIWPFIQSFRLFFFFLFVLFHWLWSVTIARVFVTAHGFHQPNDILYND